MAHVIFDHVTKVYPGDVKAVDDVNLDIQDREFLVLVGPSGCGKTTMLRMVAGLEEITAGTIRIADRVVNDVPPKDRDIAMIFQNYALYPHMTVYDNMAFGLKLRKFKKAEIEERVRAAAKILGIEPYLKRRPKALSGGQRQRVAMGRAIVREPAVFLFDEPLSNLDAKMRVQMRKEIIYLHKRVKTTMIYVTHDQVEAMTLGDRIAVVNEGRLLQVAEPLKVFEYPASLFVARFIGTPPMNIFPGRVERRNGGLVFKGDQVQAPLPDFMNAAVTPLVDKPACLGVRPKSFTVKALATEEERQITFKGTIDVIETLGEEVLIHLAIGDLRFQVSLDPHVEVPSEGELEVCPIMSRAHVFDAESEQNVTIPPDAGTTAGG
ncbi:MAG: sn-glycerol-3-phosphate ABC transporter ATP-binding protein UgpC [Lentisphaerae bacterium]|nr:sn-glycerol-3-phosphate ABC transporter ATP-binding protein UgpC [Lentisphaerota bacterium]